MINNMSLIMRFQETKNVVNAKDGGYDHVYEYIPIGQPNAATLAQLSDLQPSTEIGDRTWGHAANISFVINEDRY